MARRPKRIKTPLEDLLDETQTASFGEYLFNRYESVRNQMLAEFIPDRKTYDQQMKDDFTWRGGGRSRQAVLESGIEGVFDDIFDRQNDSLNIVGGFAAFMCARAVDDIKGTDPFYAITPEGLASDDLAEIMQQHSEWKLRSTNMGEAIDDAIDLAFGLGEGVIKLTWDREVDVFERKAVVAFNTATNKPHITATGEHIFEGDEMAEGTAPAMDEMGQPAQDPITGEQLQAPVMIPGKDPEMMLDPATLIWKEVAIEDVNITYNNVRADVMHYADFLVPLTEPDVKRSRFVGHKFQMYLSEAKEEFNLDDEAVAQFLTENSEQKTEKAKPNPEDGEQEESFGAFENEDPLILFCECWVKYDPVGDGRQRRICAVLAVQSKLIVKMDYIANSTPEGILPFFPIRAYRVKGRWYGRGMYETYAAAQEFIDRQLNRIEYRNQYHTNPAKFFDPTGLVEGHDTDEPFDISAGKTHQKKAGHKPEDIFSFIILPDLDERTWQLMQFMIQMIQVRSGVTSAAQGEVSSLPSTSTATGIESILQSASTLARLPIGNLKESLEPAITYACKLIYANVDRDEVFSYFEGDQRKAGTLIAQQVKDIDMRVRLLLTRFKQRENVESGQKAIETVNWYLGIPEQEKAGPRIVAMQVIKGLGFNQADQIIRPPIVMTTIDPVTGEEIALPPGQLPPAPALPPGEGGAPGAPQPPAGQLALPPAQ